MTTLTAGSTATFSLSNRQVLTLTAESNTTGTLKRTQYIDGQSSKTDVLGPPATNRTYGPYGHETDIEITCTYGSFEYDVTGTSLVTAETDPVTGRSVFLGTQTPVSAMDAWLQSPKLAAGLAAVKAGTDDLIILVRGDSTFAGYNGRASSFAYRLGEYLRSLGYPASNDIVAGCNWVGATDATAAKIATYYGGALTFETPAHWLTPNASGNIGFGGLSLFNAQAGSTDGMTFYPSLSYDTVVVGAIGASSTGVMAAYKGGVQLGADMNTNNGTAIEYTATRTGLTYNNDPITIRKVSGGTIQPNLIWCKSSTEKRVYIVNAARGSAKVADYVGATYLFDQRAVINNNIQPHVTINHLGINDAAAGTVAATLQADVVTLIEEDVITYGRDSLWATNAPVQIATAALAVQKGIANAIRLACADTGAPLIADLYSLLKSQAYNDAMYQVDNIHWLTAGDVAVTNHMLNGLKI